MKLANNLLSFDEEAVSPVVGVILMVAITVILAAVIGTFVLDLGGQVQQNAQAGVTFDENEGVDVQVQLNSVQSADYIFVKSSAAVTQDYTSTNEPANISGGVDNGTYEWSSAVGDTTVANFLLSDAGGGVGTTVTVEGPAYSSGETISVIGVLEGSENIIQTYNMG